MSLLTLIVVLVAVGVIMWCINEFAPMDRRFKMVLNVLVLVVVIVWLLQAFGVIDALGTVRVPRAHRH